MLGTLSFQSKILSPYFIKAVKERNHELYSFLSRERFRVRSISTTENIKEENKRIISAMLHARFTGYKTECFVWLKPRLTAFKHQKIAKTKLTQKSKYIYLFREISVRSMMQLKVQVIMSEISRAPEFSKRSMTEFEIINKTRTISWKARSKHLSLLLRFSAGGLDKSRSIERNLLVVEISLITTIVGRALEVTGCFSNICFVIEWDFFRPLKKNFLSNATPWLGSILGISFGYHALKLPVVI